VLAYLATKQQFLLDAPVIENKVAAAVLAKLGMRVGEPERNAWRNSLGNAMSHVVRDARIPDNSGIAIEYRVNGRGFRIDFMLSGADASGKESLVIIELKQWSDIDFSNLKDHVKTFATNAIRRTKRGVTPTICRGTTNTSTQRRFESLPVHTYTTVKTHGS
jgi:hypothetical protein